VDKPAKHQYQKEGTKMKWSEEKVNQLKNLAYSGKSNVEISKELGVPISEVYAKRSHLGITIDKVKAAQADGKEKGDTIEQKRIDRLYKLLHDIERKDPDAAAALKWAIFELERKN
jgi:hypothetical protein